MWSKCNIQTRKLSIHVTIQFQHMVESFNFISHLQPLKFEIPYPIISGQQIFCDFQNDVNDYVCNEGALVLYTFHIETSFALQNK